MAWPIPMWTWFKQMWTWFAAHSERVSAIAAVATAGFAVWAVLIASGQLKANNKQVQNSLIYTMQKDSREIAASYASGRATIREVLASMQSLYYQNHLGSIPSDVWTVFKEDICGFTSRPNIKNSIKSDDTEFLSNEFRSFLEEIKPPCRQKRG